MKSIVLNLIFFMPVFAFAGIPLPEHPRPDWERPESWKGRRIFLVIGASDHDTTVTFAGRKLGTYVGGYVPFEFELTDVVAFGKSQELKVKVYDPPPGKARKESSDEITIPVANKDASR